MDVKEEFRKIIGVKKDKNERYTNESSQSTVQSKRLDNYSEELLAVLDEYANEIDSTILAYNRKACEQTMMVSAARRYSQETTTRKTHMENVEGIAVEIAKKLGLNQGATRIIARNHDIGHTFYGHAGERWISNIKEDYGMGFYKHNALGPQELIYQKKIYDEILERIRAFNPGIKESELARIRKSLWLIFDGINAHNGEKTETEFKPQLDKTEGDFKRELVNCFIIKNFDKTIMPATMEGCLIRLCDKISYIPYDMVDGIREGFIDKIDEEYIPILTALGITEAEIERCNVSKNYDLIIRKLQILFTKDVIQNSTDSAIRMSDKVSKYMHELRNLNNRRIVKYTILGEDNDIFPASIRTLMNRFAALISENDIIRKIEHRSFDSENVTADLISKYEGTPDEGFIRYMTGISSEEYDFIQEIIYDATFKTVEREQELAREIVLGKKDFQREEGYENRDERIEYYIQYYKSKEIDESYTEDDATEDVDIELSREEGLGVHLGIDEKIALEFGARYLSKLSDFEMLKLLLRTKLISIEQARSLTRSYKEIGQEGLKREVRMQKELVELIRDQHVETAKIGKKDITHDIEEYQEREHDER